MTIDRKYIYAFFLVSWSSLIQDHFYSKSLEISYEYCMRFLIFRQSKLYGYQEILWT